MVRLLGEAYWSLANLKTVRFTDEEARAMRAALGPRIWQTTIGCIRIRARQDAGGCQILRESFAHYARECIALQGAPVQCPTIMRISSAA